MVARKDLIERLIAHYKAKPPMYWGYTDCANGMLAYWGEVPSIGDTQGMAALFDVTAEQANSLFVMYIGNKPGMDNLLPLSMFSEDERRDIVVHSLTVFGETGWADWRLPGDLPGAI